MIHTLKTVNSVASFILWIHFLGLSISFIPQRDIIFLLPFKTSLSKNTSFSWGKKPSAIRGWLTRHCWLYIRCNLVTRSPSNALGAFPEKNKGRLHLGRSEPFTRLAACSRLQLTQVHREPYVGFSRVRSSCFVCVPPTTVFSNSKTCKYCKFLYLMGSLLQFYI